MSADYDPRQRPCTLVAERPDGRFELDGVRWGFEQTGAFSHWKPIFSDAEVDTRTVREVYLCIEPFAPEWLAAHAFLMFACEVRNRAGGVDEGLVVSVEARMRHGEHYGLVTGMMRKFGIVYQVGTWSDAVLKCCRAQGHKIVRHPLVLDDAHKQRLLRNTLRLATADHAREFYNTLTNSCLTSAIKEINSVQPWRKRVWHWLVPGVPNVAAALPRTADVILTARGALSDAPCILTQPELVRFPANQAYNNDVTLVAARLSAYRAWRPALRGLGLVAGLGVARVLRADRVAAAALAVGGQFFGKVVANLIKSRAHTTFEPSEPYLERFDRTPVGVPQG